MLSSQSSNKADDVFKSVGQGLYTLKEADDANGRAAALDAMKVELSTNVRVLEVREKDILMRIVTSRKN